MTAVFTREEVAQHNTENSAWIVLNDKVYDVTNFLMEHPGGDEVLLMWAGNDATDAFNDVGHSADAIEMTEDYLLGQLIERNDQDIGSFVGLPDDTISDTQTDERDESWWQILRSPTWSNLLIPVALSVGVFCAYKLGTTFYGQMVSAH